jgi:hypothetical protein
MKSFFKIGSNGLPVVGSNKNSNSLPGSNWRVIKNIQLEQTEDAKVNWNTDLRYFIQAVEDEEEVVTLVKNTLTSSILVPVTDGVIYVELFADGSASGADPEARGSGLIEDDPEDLAEVVLHISEHFRDRGHRKNTSACE